MDRELVQRLRSTASEMLPRPVKEQLSALYNRYEARQADRRFRQRSQPETGRSTGGPRHVVCVVVDALRADVIDEELTTFLESTPGTTAIAPAPWTYPSVASLLTGRYPHEHGAMRQSDDRDNATAEELTLPPALPETVRTLPELLAGAGCATYGAFAFQMPFLAAAGRFEHHKLYSGASADQLLADHRGWLQEQNRPTFSYLHLGDLHEPVDPPGRYWDAHRVDPAIPDLRGWRYTSEWDNPDAERYQDHRRRLYQAAVDYVDDRLAEYWKAIENANSDAALVVTGDHGEAFWEHADFDAERFEDSRPAYCVGHGGTPYESIARVPLVGRNVGFRGGTASLVDVAPTLLDRVGINVPPETTGHSHAEPIPDDRTVLIESARYGYEKKASYYNGWKLLVSPSDDQRIGFELPAEKPTELPTGVENRLAGALPPWPEGGMGRAVSTTVQSRLEDLGYK